MSDTGKKMVTAQIEPPWAWVSYVGAVTSVLRTRGRQVDFTDVAGMSGYAFVVNVHERLCPSGPTAFDWMMLQEGTEALGLETEIVFAETDPDTDAGPVLEELFERVRQEVEKDRCCVVWGATSAPEFAVVYGYEGRSYRVRSMRSVVRGESNGAYQGLGPDESVEEPVRFDELQSPGGVGAVFFGDEVGVDRVRAERRALVRAAELLGDRHTCYGPGYHHGAAAFSAWADALASEKTEPFGNAYNAVCYGELQMFGASFCRRMAVPRPAAAAELNSAARELGRSYLNLERVKALFPFPSGGDIRNKTVTAEAADLLRDCGRAAEDARLALELALGLF